MEKLKKDGQQGSGSDKLGHGEKDDYHGHYGIAGTGCDTRLNIDVSQTVKFHAVTVNGGKKRHVVTSRS